MQAVEVLAHLRTALEAPAARHADEFHAALGPLVLQVAEQVLDRVGAELVVEEHAQLAHGQRLLRADQRGFEDASCVKCHRFGGRGGTGGPDLTDVAKKRRREEILRELIEPSKVIDDAYRSYVVTTADERVFTGILAEKTDALVSLKDSKVQVTQLKSDDIDVLTPQQQSLMPELLLRDMTADQVADLLAYLSSLK